MNRPYNGRNGWLHGRGGPVCPPYNVRCVALNVGAVREPPLRGAMLDYLMGDKGNDVLFGGEGTETMICMVKMVWTT